MLISQHLERCQADFQKELKILHLKEVKESYCNLRFIYALDAKRSRVSDVMGTNTSVFYSLHGTIYITLAC